jgi:hypothetical protein
MRELARRAGCVGSFVLRLDGRELGPDPAALDEALADAWTHERPLILLDAYECMPGLGRHLRTAVLPTLPRDTLVAIAGRQPPDAGWFEGGWEAVAATLPLGPLPPDESRAVLCELGLTADPRVPEIVGWSGGWPLALRVAADSARADPHWRPEPQAADAPVDPEAVREALRVLHVPAALAESPLARGHDMRERAESVRALIRDAADHAFGATADERLLKAILVRGYLDPATSHEQAAAELHVSRSTYFRRLRLAAERVTAYVAGRAR